jgi:glutamate synthase (NADPH/NADH) large chain
MDLPLEQGLYDPANEHDACGVGFIAHIKGNKTHEIVLQGLEILKNLDHRGAVGADPLQGDGAGILIQIPDTLFREEMAKQGVTLPPAGDYGVGMVFLPKEHASVSPAGRDRARRPCRRPGRARLARRAHRPGDAHVADRQGQGAGDPPGLHRPRPDVMVTDALERKLYVIRRRAANAIGSLKLKHSKEFYTPSMSARTINYKGLLLADQVGQYYLDLQDPRCVSALALVHQRFSTNTFPTWHLAHPFRYIAHNGEINTVRGNYNWMRPREGTRPRCSATTCRSCGR